MLNSKSLIKISAGLILVSTIGFSGKAHAQTTVPLSGAVSNTCTFGTPTAGTLVQSTTSAAMEGSSGVNGLNVGTAGKVTVTCNGGGSVTVAVPVFNGTVPTGFAQTVVQSMVQRGTTTAATDFTSIANGGTFFPGAWTGKATAPLAIPVGTSDLNVAMVAGKLDAGPLRSGNYAYNVTLTVVAN